MTFFTKGMQKTAILLDPDKTKPENLDTFFEKIHDFTPSFLFVGGSFISEGNTEELVKALKTQTDLPVLLFPGDGMQLTPHADAMLFLSLISGRNPEYLISQHVKAAPFIKKHRIKTIPTGYILVSGGGNTTTVEYITQSLPIPREKTDLAVATALAGEFLGMQCIYLEAGSGTRFPVPEDMVRAVSKNIRIPLIVGGGIKNKDQMNRLFSAGADVLVLGTLFE